MLAISRPQNSLRFPQADQVEQHPQQRSDKGRKAVEVRGLQRDGRTVERSQVIEGGGNVDAESLTCVRDDTTLERITRTKKVKQPVK